MVAKRPSRVTGVVPPLELKMSYETAACLEHLINAMSVHAQREKEKGHLALSESVERVTPFWNRVNQYLDNPKDRSSS